MYCHARTKENTEAETGRRRKRKTGIQKQKEREQKQWWEQETENGKLGEIRNDGFLSR